MESWSGALRAPTLSRSSPYIREMVLPFTSRRRLADEAQESRHKMLFQIVVDGGVHLRGEVRQQERVVAQLELIFMREQRAFIDYITCEGRAG